MKDGLSPVGGQGGMGMSECRWHSGISQRAHRRAPLLIEITVNITGTGDGGMRDGTVR